MVASHPRQMAENNKTANNKSWWECGTWEILIYCCGNAHGCSHSGNQSVEYSKVQM